MSLLIDDRCIAQNSDSFRIKLLHAASVAVNSSNEPSSNPSRPTGSNSVEVEYYFKLIYKDIPPQVIGSGLLR